MTPPEIADPTLKYITPPSVSNGRMITYEQGRIIAPLYSIKERGDMLKWVGNCNILRAPRYTVSEVALRLIRAPGI